MIRVKMPTHCYFSPFGERLPSLRVQLCCLSATLPSCSVTSPSLSSAGCGWICPNLVRWLITHSTLVDYLAFFCVFSACLQVDKYELQSQRLQSRTAWYILWGQENFSKRYQIWNRGICLCQTIMLECYDKNIYKDNTLFQNIMNALFKVSDGAPLVWPLLLVACPAIKAGIALRLKHVEA